MAGIKISALPAAPSATLSDVFPVDQLPGPVTYKESLSQVLSLFQSNGAALTKTDDTNVTVTLGGNPTIALLNATSMTFGWSGQLAVPRGGTGNSTFTAYSVICAGTTATGAFQNVSGVGTSGQVLTSNGAGALPTWQAVPAPTGAALTKVDDTNVTLTLGGTPATALLQATSITAGWTGQLSVPRGGTGLAALTAHYLPIGNGTSALTLLAPNATSGIPLISQGASADPTYGTAVVSGGGTGNTTFTAYSVICAGMTATGAFQNVSGVGSSGQVLTSNGAGALPTWQAAPGGTPAALTKVDDTNVTLTLGGTPATALLQATSITAGWTGQLAPTRGGTGIGTYTLGDTLYSSASNTLAKLAGNTTTTKEYLSQTGDGVNSAAPVWSAIAGTDVTGAALTKIDDTNVTMTLGGTPTTALLRAASMTLGWTGQLSLARGGTNANLTASNGGIFYSTASAGAILSGTATAGLALLSGASGAPTWSTNKPITQINIQVFSGHGTYTYTPTAGTTYAVGEVIGAGAGGGGAQNVATGGTGGGGGGSGSYSRSKLTAAQIGASQTITIGTGGTGGSAGNNAGSNGTDSSIGSLVIGKGGTAGNGAAAGNVGTGGAGGVAGTGDLAVAGQNGGSGINSISNSQVPFSGIGGQGFFGGGAGGQVNTNGTPVTGTTPSGYGCGGNGGVSFANGGNAAGGAGQDGYVIITEYISA